jgi:hypothetical protein
LPGKTPAEAIEAFSAPLRDCLACVLPPTAVVHAYGQKRGDQYLLTLLGHRGEPVPLGGPHGVGFRLAHHYAVVPAGDPDDPFRVRSLAYYYTITTARGREAIAYHWHPDSEGADAAHYPHIHVRSYTQPLNLSHKHPPTGRVSLEAVIRFLIDELGVDARRPNYAAILDQSEQAFKDWRHWS